MSFRILIIIGIGFLLNSCGIFKTHHKSQLIDFKNNIVSNESLKLDGYYYREYEIEYGENAPSFITNYIKETGIHKIKYLSVFFIYEDGFVSRVGGINGLSRYYCAEKESYDNTYESAHETIELMLQSQYSEDKRTRRICGFRPNDIGNKGLVAIKGDSIKLQLYQIEMQNPTKDSFNSAYLYESNGIIKSDSSFVLQSEIEYRTNTITTKNLFYQFRKTKQKPTIENYFMRNKNRFK